MGQPMDIKTLVEVLKRQGRTLRISGEDKQCARQLADELLKPGNLLMENMKKARILINQRNQA